MIQYRYMNDTISEKRRLQILQYLYKDFELSRKQLADYLPEVSRITLIRDLNYLKSKGLVISKNGGPKTTYLITDKARLLKLYDLDDYFTQESESRPIQFRSYSLERLEYFTKSLTKSDLRQIKQVVAEYNTRQNNDVVKQELERFIIEFSWKSSQIEGNTYSLLDTEQLIKNSIQAKGHSQEEATMIVNHKTAFDYIWQNQPRFSKISKSNIEEVHSLLVNNLNIESGIRQSRVGIVGTGYIPPASRVEIASHLDQLTNLINNCPEPTIAGLLTLVGLSYLQPFVDGNKRTARLMTNALLLSKNYPPISYRTVDEVDYKKALILFYEQGATAYIKDLFVSQMKFAGKNYNLGQSKKN